MLQVGFAIQYTAAKGTIIDRRNEAVMGEGRSEAS